MELKYKLYNRPYDKYKKHLQNLVNFGSLSNYMMDKYLKNFINKAHEEALKINKRPYSMVEAIIDNVIDVKELEKNVR